MRRLFVWGLIVVVVFSSATLNFRPPQVKKVVIDAGHGGFDPGCLGKFSKEKDVALDIALELGELINRFHDDVEVIYTRKRYKDFVRLRNRAIIANRSQADLFISIHCNAHPIRSVFGTETYVMGLSSSQENLAVAMRENSVILREEGYEEHYNGFDPKSTEAHILLANFQQAHQERSISLATKIEEQFAVKAKRSSRGVKQAGFLVLAKTAMPSVLVETGFLTNGKEEAYLNSEIGKSFIAAGIYRAFRDYKKEVEDR